MHILHPPISQHSIKERAYMKIHTFEGNTPCQGCCTPSNECICCTCCGPAGATGPTGPTGATGVTGATGPTGATVAYI